MRLGMVSKTGEAMSPKDLRTIVIQSKTEQHYNNSYQILSSNGALYNYWQCSDYYKAKPLNIQEVR